MESWKLISEKTKATNDELKATLDSILDEKLTTDLKNQSLMRRQHSVDDGNSSMNRREQVKGVDFILFIFDPL